MGARPELAGPALEAGDHGNREGADAGWRLQEWAGVLLAFLASA